MEISSEAKKTKLQEPEKPVEEMTDEELKAFRTSFDPDMMGFDGTEGVDGDGSEDTGEEDPDIIVEEAEADEENEEEGGTEDGSEETEN